MSDTIVQSENVFNTPSAEKDEEKHGFKPKVSFWRTTIGQLEWLTMYLEDSCSSPSESR